MVLAVCWVLLFCWVMLGWYVWWFHRNFDWSETETEKKHVSYGEVSLKHRRFAGKSECHIFCNPNGFLSSYQSSFSQKLQQFVLTCGSTSYCFHLQSPVTCSICQRIIYVQGYVARGTFSRSRLARKLLLILCCFGHAVRLVCASRI